MFGGRTYTVDNLVGVIPMLVFPIQCYMVVFLFNIVIYVFLLKESMCSCILIVRPCILNIVHVFLLLSMYSYCLSMYSYRCLCILTVVHVFLDTATLTEVFPCFLLSCKASARV